jgi:hypothetical protein
MLVNENNVFTAPNFLTDTINYGVNYIIDGTASSENPENVKGVFKIDATSPLLQGTDSIKPIGLQFIFNSDKNNNNVITGIPSAGVPGLRDLTKGFFIVRQKRIPTILSQGIGIGTSSNTFIPLIQGYNSINSQNGDTLTGQ